MNTSLVCGDERPETSDVPTTAQPVVPKAEADPSAPQEKDPASEVPVTQEAAALIVAAGVDRLIEDVEYLLDIVQMSHLSQVVQVGLNGANGLAGIDRTRPWGMLLFLDPNDPHAEPVPLVFLPVDDVPKLIETAAKLNLHMKAVDAGTDGETTSDTEHRYTIQLGEVAHPLVISGGYARLTRPGMRAVDATPRQIRDLSDSLAQTYDLAISVRRKGIPESLFQEASKKLTADQERERMRKPNETDEAFALRSRAEGAIFRSMFSILEQSQGLLAGVSISSQDKSGQVEVLLQTSINGDLAKRLDEISLRQRRFATVRQEDAALSVLTGMRLSDEGVALGTQVIDLIRHEAKRQSIPDLTADERERGLKALDAIQSIISSRLLEGFAQFRSEPEEQFTLLVGLAVPQTEGLRISLETLLPKLSEAPNVTDVEVNVSAGEHLQLHRLKPAKIRSRDVRLYGDSAALYMGTGRQTAWFAVGGRATPAKLIQREEQAGRSLRVPLMNDTVTDTPDGTATTQPLVQLTAHAMAWLPLVEQEPGRNVRVGELLKSAFPNQESDDKLEATLTSTGSGLAFKLRLEEGYLRLAMRAVAENR
ncbi:MAG: hypothetical protein R3C01_00460 [Planctomycetaceae bacterium]